MSLVECIPNFSEGRRAGFVDELAASFAAQPGVRLLHRHTDIDHNRSVFTVVGSPPELLRALEDLFETALSGIDLSHHQGVHPRIGAVDVCPFVPLPAYGSDIEQCVALAREFGERCGAGFDVPVFLYREAATANGRTDLAQIRQGQFEGLEAKLASEGWGPDYGPSTPHARAGATAVGARGPLIAYNMVLDTDDVQVAREIATEVRAQTGGFAGIKALGVALDSRRLVQVSMNIEDPVATPLEVISGEVEGLAQVRGIAVRETELVGLIPQQFVTPAAEAWLGRGEFGPHLILENAIAASGIETD